MYIASGDWQLFWEGKLGSSLKEPLMNGIFFLHFVLHAGSTITAKTYVLICLPPLFTICRRLSSTEVTSRGLSILSRNVKPFAERNNSASFDLVVTFSSRNQGFLDSSWWLIRNQRKIGLKILFGCSCRVPPSFDLQISSWTGSRRPRTLCSLPYIFGKMAKLVAILCFRSRTTQGYVGLCIRLSSQAESS